MTRSSGFQRWSYDAMPLSWNQPGQWRIWKSISFFSGRKKYTSWPECFEWEEMTLGKNLTTVNFALKTAFEFNNTIFNCGEKKGQLVGRDSHRNFLYRSIIPVPFWSVGRGGRRFAGLSLMMSVILPLIVSLSCNLMTVLHSVFCSPILQHAAPSLWNINSSTPLESPQKL